MPRIARRKINNLRRLGDNLWTDGKRRYKFYDPAEDIIIVDGLANRLLATDSDKKVVSVPNLSAWIGGTTNQITVTPNLSGSVVLSTPQDIAPTSDVTFNSQTLTSLTASKPVFTDANKKLVSKDISVAIEYPLSMYDAEPNRSSETNWHGGLLSLATGQPLDSTPTDIIVTKGIGKLMVVVNAGTDISGTITITGTTIDRNTGVPTASDTDTITVDTISTDNTTTDANGNTVHSFTDAYITSKWFHGTVTLSTSDLTLTDVDVYHVSFEQNNDNSDLTINTLDANIYTTNNSAEFDCYLYTLHVTSGSNKCRLDNEASLHVGAVGLTALANRYERLRIGNINESLDGATDGWWCDVHYSNSPAYIEDVTITVWFTKDQTAT